MAPNKVAIRNDMMESQDSDAYSVLPWISTRSTQTHGTGHDPWPCPQNLNTVQSRTVTVYGRGSIEELADLYSWKDVQRKCISLLEMHQ